MLLNESANIFPIEERIDHQNNTQSEKKNLVLYNTEIAFEKADRAKYQIFFLLLDDQTQFLPLN